jgi:hypothetical protein
MRRGRTTQRNTTQHNTTQHSATQPTQQAELPLAKKFPKDNQLDLVKVPQLSVLPPLAPLG